MAAPTLKAETVLTRTLNAFAKKLGKRKESDSNLAENIREGLTALLSVKVPEPEFEGQTKTKLGNTEVRGIVDNLVGEALSQFLEFNPSVIGLILEKAIERLMPLKPPAGPHGGARAFWAQPARKTGRLRLP